MNYISRRGLFAFMGAAALAATIPSVAHAEGSSGVSTMKNLKAGVYRGPAASPGCPEAVKALLESYTAANISVEYIGPVEVRKLDSRGMSGLDIYAQPGGGTLSAAWQHISPSQQVIRDFVSSGGKYLGFCLGAYLAGSGPGLGLMESGDTDQYINTAGAQVKGSHSTKVKVDWNGFPKGREIYFQDGARLILPPGAVSLAKYSGGYHIAAGTMKYGSGKVGLVGPHPEADSDWFDSSNTVPSTYAFDLGHDLITQTLA